MVIGLLACEPGEISRSDSPVVMPGLLLIDDTVVPEVWVAWSARGASERRSGERAFGAPDEAAAVEGTNLLVGVALGGTRLERGVARAGGAVLRVEVRKAEVNRALLAGVDPGSTLRFGVRGVRFDQPVRVEGQTAVVHLRYSLRDMEACSLPADAASQFLLADPEDRLGGVAVPGRNVDPRGLWGGEGGGRAEARVEDDGTVSFEVEIPFGMLRHLRDPWKSELPGTFFEPIRLHAEVEVVPVGAPPAAGPQPGRTGTD